MEQSFHSYFVDVYYKPGLNQTYKVLGANESGLHYVQGTYSLSGNIPEGIKISFIFSNTMYVIIRM